MKRLVAMVVAAGAAMAAVAMPTKAELQKAQEMVSDVTAADVAALRAKSKTPSEVAAKHMELAGQAGSEAEKYLLLQAAFKLYAKAGDYDAAANVIEKLQVEISDYDPEVTVELCGAEFIRKMRENAPRLYALKENARRIVFYRKQLPIREAAVKKNPRDQQAQRKLAECHAELGDWPKAREVFVKAGGELKKMAEGETSGKVPAQELGDFWWDYETKSDTQVYKLHAAELYRKALADDSFKGLARTRAEQRVQECEATSADLPPVVTNLVAGNAATTTTTDAKDTNACYPREDFGGELLSSKYELMEFSGELRHVRYLDGLFNRRKTVEEPSGDFAFGVCANRKKEAGFTLMLPEPIALAGLLVVNRTKVTQERQVPLCVWASENRVKWERIFIDESVRDEYRIDLSKKNITCKYLRFGRLPGVNNEPFHLARTLVYAKKAGVGVDRSGSSLGVTGKAPIPKCKMANGRPAPLKFELAKGVDLELEGCPAGTFTMGYAAGMWNDDGKAAPKHEVTITRPFWIGKFQVTRGQAKSLDVTPNDSYLEVQSAFDGKGGDTCSAVMTFDNINAFCRKLTEKFAAKIPTGYVFRLASNAEWEYASKAGDYSEKNPAMLYSGHKENPYILTRHDKLELLKRKNIEWKDSPVVLPAFPAGLKRPNGWGIFDMLGNHPEVTMDRIPKNAPDVVNYKQGKESGIIHAITHARQETDPLMYYESDWNLLVRGRWDNYLLMEALPANRIQYAGGFGYTFRVCLGPDLIAEKKAKK